MSTTNKANGAALPPNGTTSTPGAGRGKAPGSSGRAPSTLIEAWPAERRKEPVPAGQEQVELILRAPDYPLVDGWQDQIARRLPFTGKRQLYRVATSLLDHGPNVAEWHVDCRVTEEDTLSDSYVTVRVRAWCPAGKEAKGMETPASRFARFVAQNPRVDERISESVQTLFWGFLRKVIREEPTRTKTSDKRDADARSSDARAGFIRDFQAYCAAEMGGPGGGPGLQHLSGLRFQFDILLPETRPVVVHDFVCPVQLKGSAARLDVRVGLQMVPMGVWGIAKLLVSRVRDVDVWAKDAVQRMVIEKQYAADALILLSQFPETVEDGLRAQLKLEAASIGYEVQTMTGTPLWSGTTEEPEEYRLLTKYEYRSTATEWLTADPSIKAPVTIAFRTSLPTLDQQRIRDVFRSRQGNRPDAASLEQAITQAVNESVRRCVQGLQPSEVYLRFEETVQTKLRLAVLNAVCQFLPPEVGEGFRGAVEARIRAMSPMAGARVDVGGGGSARELPGLTAVHGEPRGSGDPEKKPLPARVQRAAEELADSLEVRLEDNRVYALWRSLQGKAFEMQLRYLNSVNVERSATLTAAFKIEAIGEMTRDGSPRDYRGFLKFLQFLNTPNITDVEVIKHLLQSLSVELSHHVQDRLSAVPPQGFEPAMAAARRDLMSRGQRMSREEMEMQQKAHDMLLAELDWSASSFFVEENGLSLKLKRLTFEPDPRLGKGVESHAGVQAGVKELRINLVRRRLEEVRRQIDDPGTPASEIDGLLREVEALEQHVGELTDPSNGLLQSPAELVRLIRGPGGSSRVEPTEDDAPRADGAAARAA